MIVSEIWVKGRKKEQCQRQVKRYATCKLYGCKSLRRGRTITNTFSYSVTSVCMTAIVLLFGDSGGFSLINEVHALSVYNLSSISAHGG